jgi:hypothetical protein
MGLLPALLAASLAAAAPPAWDDGEELRLPDEPLEAPLGGAPPPVPDPVEALLEAGPRPDPSAPPPEVPVRHFEREVLELRDDELGYLDQRAPWRALTGREWRTCEEPYRNSSSVAKEFRVEDVLDSNGAVWKLTKVRLEHGEGYEGLNKTELFLCMGGRWVKLFADHLRSVELSSDLKEAVVVTANDRAYRGGPDEPMSYWRVRADNLLAARVNGDGRALIQEATWVHAYLPARRDRERPTEFLSIRLNPIADLGPSGVAMLLRSLDQEGLLARGSPFADAGMRVAAARWVARAVPPGSGEVRVVVFPQPAQLDVPGGPGPAIEILELRKEATVEDLRRHRARPSRAASKD